MKPTTLPILVLLMGLVAPPAYAAEGGLLSPQPGLIFWTIVTFVIVLVVLWRFAYPHILGAVEAREKRIEELRAEAEASRAAAAALVTQRQQELDELRERAQEVIAEARTAAEHMREEIMTEARREQEALLARTAGEVKQQVERAMQTLRAEAVDVAIAAAEKVIHRNLDDAENRRLVEEYLTRLENESAELTAGV